MRFYLKVDKDVIGLALRHGAEVDQSGRWFVDGDRPPGALMNLVLDDEPADPGIQKLVSGASRQKELDRAPGACVPIELTRNQDTAEAIETTIRFALERFGTRRRAEIWLSTFKVTLQGKSPIDYMKRGPAECLKVAEMILAATAD